MKIFGCHAGEDGVILTIGDNNTLRLYKGKLPYISSPTKMDHYPLSEIKDLERFDNNNVTVALQHVIGQAIEEAAKK